MRLIIIFKWTGAVVGDSCICSFIGALDSVWQSKTLEPRMPPTPGVCQASSFVYES